MYNIFLIKLILLMLFVNLFFKNGNKCSSIIIFLRIMNIKYLKLVINLTSQEQADLCHHFNSQPAQSDQSGSDI